MSPFSLAQTQSRLLFLSACSILPFSVQAAEDNLSDLLSLDLTELTQLTVTTATKSEVALKDVPGTVRVVTAKTIAQRGYQSLQQLLTDLPGFQFRDTQGFNSYAFLRGLPNQNNYILLLVDGIQVNELNSGGFYLGNQFNLANVKQVEVLYGPSSALYGSNALSGVINIITHNPKDSAAQGSSVSVTAGSFNTRQVQASLAQYNADKEQGFSLALQLNDTDKADLAGEDGDNNWTSDMENFERNVSINAKYQWQALELGLLHQNKNSSRTTNYNTVSDGYADSGTDWHIHFTNLWLKHNHPISEDLSLRSHLYYRNATVEKDTIAYINSGDGQVAYYRPNSLMGIEEQVNYRYSDSVRLLAGLIYEQEQLAQGFTKVKSGDVNTSPETPSKPDMLDNTLSAIYLQSHLLFDDHWSSTLGIRHEESSYYGNFNAPRASLIFQDQALVWKLNYMEAFRAPKPWDFTYGAGNDNLKPEEMRSLESTLSYQWNPALSTEVRVFNNKVSNKLVKQGSSPNDFWGNQGHVDLQGTEISLQYQKPQYSLDLNYSFIDSKDQDGNPTLEIADHLFNASVQYKLSSKWDINLRGHYSGARNNPKLITATNRRTVAENWVFNTAINYNASPQLQYQLVVNNLLDTEYYHTSNRPAERYRQPQRNLLFTVKYTFE